MVVGHYGLYGPYLYDYHLYYPAHQCVITDYYHQSVWMSGNISVCLAIRVCAWECTTYKAIVFSFFLFITQIILIITTRVGERASVFTGGEKVLVLLSSSSSKSLAKWQVPFVVARRVGDLDYEVKRTDSGDSCQIFHLNRLKHCIEVTSVE